jgi:SAM-dependent methyltransferase
MTWQQRWNEHFYSGRPDWVDGTTEFHHLCRSQLRGGAIVEIGAGPTNATSAFLATLGTVHGIDVSDEVEGNAHLAEAKVMRPDGSFPFDDEAFDGAVSNYVAEHVADPRLHLREVRRVLRPGAPYVFRTPNLFHYVAMASRLTPHRLHVRIANRLRALDHDAHDPWPTIYAMNTPADVRALAAEEGFDVEELRLVEKDPSYGMASRAMFLVFMAYERLVNSTERLAALRANMFVVLRKRQISKPM